MPWIILIMAAPLLGISLYLFIGLNGSTRRMRKRYEKSEEKLIPYLQQDPAVLGRLCSVDQSAANIAGYLLRQAHYPVYQNTDVDFYEDAALGIEAQKVAFRHARKFIFMEYHAIEDAES